MKTKKLLLITLMLAIAGIMQAGPKFYLCGKRLEVGKVLTPQNSEGIIKAGTVTLTDENTVVMDNAVIVCKSSDAALEFWSNEKYTSRFVKNTHPNKYKHLSPGGFLKFNKRGHAEMMDPDNYFVYSYPHAFLEIKGECHIINYGSGYGIQVKTSDAGDIDRYSARLVVKGEGLSSSKLFVKSVESNAIYLYGRKKSSPYVTDYSQAAILFSDVFVKLEAPNGNAIRGRQNKKEFYSVAQSALVYIPETCAGGAIMQCINDATPGGGRLPYHPYGPQVYASEQPVEAPSGSLVNKSDGKPYKGKLVLGQATPIKFPSLKVITEKELPDFKFMTEEGKPMQEIPFETEPKGMADLITFSVASGGSKYDASISQNKILRLKPKYYSRQEVELTGTIFGMKANLRSSLYWNKLPYIDYEIGVPIRLNQTKIYPSNARDLTQVDYYSHLGGIKGDEITYRRDLNILYLTNAYIEGVFQYPALRSDMPLTIYLKGNNVLEVRSAEEYAAFVDGKFSILGDPGAKLTIRHSYIEGRPGVTRKSVMLVTEDLYISKNVTVEVEGRYRGTIIGKDLKVNGSIKFSTVERKPVDIKGDLILDGATISYPLRAYHGNSISYPGSGGTPPASVIGSKMNTSIYTEEHPDKRAIYYEDGAPVFGEDNKPVVISKVTNVVPASSISLPESITINEGEEIRLQHTILPAGATNKNVSWHSSDPDVATVTGSGMVKGVKARPGKTDLAYITVRTDNGKSAKCLVGVKSNITRLPLEIAGIRVNTANASDIKGEGITGKVSYNHATKTLTLENATINKKDYKAIVSHQDGLTIRLIGTNKVASIKGEAAYTSAIQLLGNNNVIEGPSTAKLYAGTQESGTGIYIHKGNFTVKGGCQVIAEGKFYGIDGGGFELVVENSVVKAKGTGKASFSGLVNKYQLAGVGVTMPAGAYIARGTVYKPDKTVAKDWVVLDKVDYYDVFIDGIRVHSGNAASIHTPNSEGDISYDPGFGTLSLKSATIYSKNGPAVVAHNKLKIEVSGDNVLWGEETIDGTAIEANDLEIVGGLTDYKALRCQGAIVTLSSLSIKDCNAEAEGKYGFLGFGSGDLNLHNCNISARGSEASIKGFKAMNMTDCGFDPPSGSGVMAFDPELMAVTEDGEIHKGWYVYVKRPVFYDLWLGNTRVSKVNKDDIFGDGTAKYNPDINTLTLEDAFIATDDMCQYCDPLESNIDGLTIKLWGQNTLIATDYADGMRLEGTYTHIMGPGSLIISGGHEGAGINYKGNLKISDCSVYVEGEYGGISGNEGKLTLINSTLTTLCDPDGYNGSMSGVGTLEIEGLKILAPENAEFGGRSGLSGITTDDGRTYTTEKVIIGPEHYNLMIDGELITPLNAADIITPNTSGYIGYEPGTNTLVMGGASIITDKTAITGKEMSNKLLRIVLQGENYIENTGANLITYLNSPTVIRGSGSLKIKDLPNSFGLMSGFKPLTIAGGCTVEVDGGEFGLCEDDGEATLTIDSATVKMRGTTKSYDFGNLELINASIVEPAGAVFNPDTWNIELNGSPVKNEWVVIQAFTKYPIWVAGTQVTTENLNDITGHGIYGTISYDPGAKALTLNEAFIEIAQVQTQTNGIYVKDQDLEIKLIGYNKIENCGIGDGIWNYNGNLTISGASSSSLDIIGDQGGYMDGYSIYTPENLTITGCSVYGISNLDGIHTGKSLYLQNEASLIGMSSGQSSRYPFGVKAKNIEMTDGSTLQAIGNYAMGLDYGIDIYPGALLFEGESKNSLAKVTELSLDGGLALMPYIIIRPAGTEVKTLTSQDIKVMGLKSEIRIITDSEDHKYASVYNLSGSLVRVAELEGKETTIGNLLRGIYIVRIGNAAEKVIVQ